ncbi:Na+/H+ antiporter [Blastococcus sp. SYSU D00820]
MNGLEITVMIGTAVFAGAVLAPRLRMAVPLLLLVLGLLLGFVPEFREVELPPETVLLLFLPVMLFWESLTTSLRSIRRDLRGILIMSTLMVVVTAFAVAGIAYALGMPWPVALVLGAALAPSDATAVAALGRMLPHRHFMLLKAESLTNDGTALVVFALAVGLAVGDSVTPLEVTERVLLSYVGGILAGALVAAVAYRVLRGLRDATAINLGLLLVPMGAYLAAESVEASGVLAVVVAGLVVSYVSARISTAASRRQADSAWPLGTFVLNGALFVLIGLEFQAVVRELAARDVGRLLAVVVTVWIGMLVVRFGFQTLSVLVIRLLDRRPSQRARRTTYRARIVHAVAGFRGAISLALALSVPATTPDGGAVSGREDVVVVTAGVIILTLLVQGPLLPAVVRWARLPEDTTSEEELQLAYEEISRVAVEALPDLVEEHGISEETRERLVREHEERTRDAAPVATAPPVEDGAVTVAEHRRVDLEEEYTRLRLAVLDRKREVLVRLRRQSAIDDSVARRVHTRLDIEELRLTGVEPVD